MRVISIIVPALREGSAVARLASAFKGTPGVTFVAALAEGDDETEEPEKRPGVTVVRSAPGRGTQMNAGAMVAEGDILLFLHADTRIDPRSLGKARAVMERPDVALGFYRLRIDSPSPKAGIISAAANVRCALLKTPYGDQVFFLRREVFEKIGGFPDVPLMEDAALAAAAKRIGGLARLDDFAVTSARRWERRGYLKNTLRNWSIALAWKAGVGPEKLYKIYYGADKRPRGRDQPSCSG
ncbi:MAG: TIGR04283 family arsenosugar biosynthesis glycosyltransferase [Candidatus Nitrospinota bacterium M3_3B_026]